MGARTRLLAVADAEEVARVLSAERAFMAPYEPARSDAFYTAPGQREVLRLRLARHAAGTEVPRAIVDDAGAVIGGITLQSIERGPFLSCGLGYWVAQAEGGRGYASQAVAEMLDLAFGPLALHRVQAVTLLDNLRSQRVLAKNGFVRIGTAPRLLHLAGAWRDHHLFQRLSD